MTRRADTTYYTRHLPHVHPAGATFFVTCHLVDAVPPPIRQALLAEAESRDRDIAALPEASERLRYAYFVHRFLFGRWDKVLDGAAYGPQWLSEPRVAQLVAQSLHYRHERDYDLLAFCIMPNHVHVVFTPLACADGTHPSLTAIMQSLKAYTARKANAILRRDGQFWQRESYDHWVRDDQELLRIIQYVVNNPVKAGLVDHWEDWSGTFCRYSPIG